VDKIGQNLWRFESFIQADAISSAVEPGEVLTESYINTHSSCRLESIWNPFMEAASSSWARLRILWIDSVLSTWLRMTEVFYFFVLMLLKFHQDVFIFSY